MKALAFAAPLLILSLSGCGGGSSMQELTQKAEKARTREQLESALGKPDKFEKADFFGVSTESWTYKASDGEVNYTLINGKVKTTAAMSKKKE